jgi:hypothetical protein
VVATLVLAAIAVYLIRVTHRERALTIARSEWTS